MARGADGALRVLMQGEPVGTLAQTDEGWVFRRQTV